MTVGGDHLGLRDNFLAVGIFHRDGDGVSVGIVQDDIGAGVGAGRAHGIVVVAAPLGKRGDGVPVVAESGAANARTHVHLHRGRGSDHAPGLDAVREIPGLPLVKRIGPFEHPVAVQIQPHDGAVGLGHDADPGNVELIPVDRHVFAGRHHVLPAPLGGVRHFHRTGQQRLWPGIPSEPGNRHRTGHADLVAAIPEDIGLEAGNRNLLDGIDHLAAGNAIIRRRSACHRIGSFGRTAVPRVEIAPNLGRALRGAGQVGLVAVLPMVVVDHRVAGEA